MTREEAIKILMSATVWDDDERKALDILIPELRESEDERIRKAIIKSIEEDSSVYEQKVSKEQMLAYLEKQKYDRMKPIYDARESFESALEKAWNDYHNGYENVDKLEDDYVECAHAKGFREGFLFGIEKQKEIPTPNSTELIDMWDKEKATLMEKEFCGNAWRLAQNAFMDGFARGTCVKSEKQEEQKVKSDIIGYTTFSDGSTMPIKDRTKEQKPVVTHGEIYHVDTLGTQQVIAGKMPQKPVEWSEEDEEMLNSCISIIEKRKDVRSGWPMYGREIAWLKEKFKSPTHSSWKPSEEQMMALHYASYGGELGPDELLLLNSLYEQLDKLM